jgi:hypothetical protein
MNTRETKNVRKKAERVLKTLEAQAKKNTDTQKIVKDFLKGFDEIVASSTKVKVAKPAKTKPVKVAKAKAAKPAKAIKAKPAKPAKAIKAKAAKPVKAIKAKAAKAKAEKPVKATKAAKPVKTPRGDKPSLHEAIYKVMGNKTMNAEAVLAVLKEKGWAPNAQNQKGYVAYMLSSKKNLFARAQDKGRGFYKRIEKAAEAKAEAKPEAKPEAKAAAKPEAKPEAKPAKNNQKDEQILAELGVKTSAVAENPFRS